MPAAPKLIIPSLGRIYEVFWPITEPLIRLMAGGSLAYHGYQILFGNIEGAARFFENVGFDNGILWAWVVGILEFDGPLIAVWREYYDRAQLLRAQGKTAETHKA